MKLCRDMEKRGDVPPLTRCLARVCLVYYNTIVILREEVWSAYRAQVARENSFHHRAMALINALEWY